MSFLDKVGNRVEKMRSQQSENADVSSFRKQIETEEKAIDLLIIDIGNYYWGKYANGEMDAPEEIAEVFKDIEQHIETKKELEGKIDDRKLEGAKQRVEIDKNTQETVRRKAEEAEERKRQREEAKRVAEEEKRAAEEAKAADKAAEEVTSGDNDQF